MKSKTSGIVLINYFNEDELISFISNELLTQSEAQFSIFVLNNGSHDPEALKKFCDMEKNIEYFDAGKNLGYIGGFLFVFEQIRRRLPGLIILSNTDIEFRSKQFMASLSEVDFPDSMVIAGPSVISARTNHEQNPFYRSRLSIRKLKRLSFIFSSYVAYFMYQILSSLKNAARKGSSEEQNNNMEQVYAIHGSFMIFKSEFIDKYFEELKDAPFLFGEEIQFAEVALKHHLKTVFIPGLQIIHHEHATTKLFKSGKMLRFLKDSIDFRLKKRMHEEHGVSDDRNR
jgi:GT2 family glycosyltransferase